MKMTSELQPKFINCKEGFIRYYRDELSGKPVFLGFTSNLRTATPLYGSSGAAISIAKKLMQSLGKNYSYFAIVEPALIGFDKEKEIA